MKLDRKKFRAAELSACLSHYDLGVIHRIRQFPRGSRRSPKVLIEAEKGKYLFKRRAHGKDSVEKVAFTHEIQLCLAERGFPLPHLIRTRDQDSSMLVLADKVYEMFEYVDGQGYDGSLDSTYHAGHILGLYHKLLQDFRSVSPTPVGSYHSAESIHLMLRETISSLPLENRPPADVIVRTVRDIERVYVAAAAEANALGIGDWPAQIVHGDWHPGNMLFRDGQVAAVIDYDAARTQARVLDVANGVLQFSIIGGGDDPDTWPDYVDESRFKRFLLGYDSASTLSKRELDAIPYLMCEALIAEAVLPIAATGSFGRIAGFPFLQMIDRKTQWILSHADELRSVLQRQ